MPAIVVGGPPPNRSSCPSAAFVRAMTPANFEKSMSPTACDAHALSSVGRGSNVVVFEPTSLTHSATVYGISYQPFTTVPVRSSLP